MVVIEVINFLLIGNVTFSETLMHDMQHLAFLVHDAKNLV